MVIAFLITVILFTVALLIWAYAWQRRQTLPHGDGDKGCHCGNNACNSGHSKK